MKKNIYNTKSKIELNQDLKNLKSILHSFTIKGFGNKNNKEYLSARKNVARVLTALNDKSKNSTEIEK